MLLSPIYCRTFGNIEIKIWSYPKDVVKCLLKGLCSDRKSHEKMVNAIGFKHCFYDEYGGCNCNEKVEEICFKYSIKAYRQGNIFIPIEISNCKTNSQRTFISELRAALNPNRSSDRKALNIISEPNRRTACLLNLPIDCTNSGLSRCIKDADDDKEDLQILYEDMIKHLLKNLSCDTCNNKKSGDLDKNRFFELCLENNLTSENIVAILKNLKCGQNIDLNACIKKMMCRNCEIEKQNDGKCSSSRKYKVVNLPTSKCNDNVKDDCQELTPQELRCGKVCGKQKSSLTKFQFNEATNCSPTDCKQDIREIKTALKEIIEFIGGNETNDCKAIESSEVGFNTDTCDENKPMNSEEILQEILQHICQCKCNKSIKDSELHDKVIPVIKSPEKIPIISNAIETQSITTVDALCPTITTPQTPCPQICSTTIDACCPDIKVVMLPSQCCPTGCPSPESAQLCPTTIDARNTNAATIQSPSLQGGAGCNDSQNTAIKHALEVAGIPKNISDYISKLTPTEFNDGVTNIYYNVNTETGDVMVKSMGKASSELHKPEYAINKDDIPKVNDFQENVPSSYSHIIVDINIQQSDGEELYDDEAIEQTPSTNVSVRKNKMPEQGIYQKDSNKIQSVRDLNGSAQIASAKSSKTSEKSGSIKSYKENGYVPEDDEAETNSKVVQFSTSRKSKPEECIPVQCDSRKKSRGTEPIGEIEGYVMTSRTTEPNGVDEHMIYSGRIEPKQIDVYIRNSTATETNEIDEVVRKSGPSKLDERNSKARSVKEKEGSIQHSKASETKGTDQRISGVNENELVEESETTRNETKENDKSIKKSTTSTMKPIDGSVRFSNASEKKQFGASLKSAKPSVPNNLLGSMRNSKSSETKELESPSKNSKASEAKLVDSVTRLSKASEAKETSMKNSKSSGIKEFGGSIRNSKASEAKLKETSTRVSKASGTKEVGPSIRNSKSSESKELDGSIRKSNGSKSKKKDDSLKNSKGSSSKGSGGSSRGSQPKRRKSPCVRTSVTNEPLNMEGTMRSYSDNKQAYGSMNPPFERPLSDAKPSAKLITGPISVKSSKNSKVSTTVPKPSVTNESIQKTKSSATVSENVVLLVNEHDNPEEQEFQKLSKLSEITQEKEEHTSYSKAAGSQKERLDSNRHVDMNEPLEHQYDPTQYDDAMELLPDQESSIEDDKENEIEPELSLSLRSAKEEEAGSQTDLK